MSRNPYEYGRPPAEPGLEHLTIPPTQADYQRELIEKLDSPGRYPHNSKHAFGTNTEFQEGSLLTFDSLETDSKSNHPYSPKQRAITDVLEAATHTARYFNDEERREFAQAITDQMTAQQTAIIDKFIEHKSFTNELVTVKAYDNYRNTVTDIVEATIDPNSHYRPHTAAQDITAFSSGQFDGELRYGDSSKAALNFADLSSKFPDDDPSERGYLLVSNIDAILQSHLDFDARELHATRMVFHHTVYDRMETALDHADQTAYDDAALIVDKVSQVTQYRPDHSTFLSSDIMQPGISFSIGPDNAALFEPGGQLHHQMQQRIEKIDDPQLHEFAGYMLDSAASINFYEDHKTAYMGAWSELSDFMDAYDAFINAHENYQPGSHQDTAAPFTRFNVDAGYLYQKVFDNPDQNTSEAQRLLYDTIADHTMPSLRYAQSVGDAQAFENTLDHARTTRALRRPCSDWSGTFSRQGLQTAPSVSMNTAGRSVTKHMLPVASA